MQTIFEWTKKATGEGALFSLWGRVVREDGTACSVNSKATRILSFNQLRPQRVLKKQFVTVRTEPY